MDFAADWLRYTVCASDAFKYVVNALLLVKYVSLASDFKRQRLRLVCNPTISAVR